MFALHQKSQVTCSAKTNYSNLYRTTLCHVYSSLAPLIMLPHCTILDRDASIPVSGVLYNVNTDVILSLHALSEQTLIWLQGL